MSRSRFIWTFIRVSVSPIFRWILGAYAALSVVSLAREFMPSPWSDYHLLRYIPRLPLPTWLALLAIISLAGVIEAAYTQNQLAEAKSSGRRIFTASGEEWIRPRKPFKASAIATGFFCVCAVVVVAAVLRAHRQPHDHPDESTMEVQTRLTSWGIYPPFKAYAFIDARQLFPYKERYQLMLVIRAADRTIDPLDDPNIMKSLSFDVSDHDLEIDIQMSQKFLHHMVALNPNYAAIDYWQCVLPTGLQAQQIETLRGIIKRGGTCQFGGENSVGHPFAVVPGRSK